ncbi:MAG TPA: rhamnogalacturonan acetylesterase [Pirellulales bacterium]|nr:rhamnogalacturonan acetylesterase [Pirellulales bacterium]
MAAGCRTAFALGLLAAIAQAGNISAQAGQDQTTHKFSFAPGNNISGYTQVSPETTYSKELGYGFEPGAQLKTIEQAGGAAAHAESASGDLPHSGCVTSDKPFYFSIALPEGNYKVTVTLGNPAGDSTMTVKAELRRLMLEHVHTEPGKFETHTFDVNIRTPQIAGGSSVHLKPREKTDEAWAWDDKLTLEFNDAKPCLCAVEIEPADNIPTVYLLGDSTVCDQPLEPWNSWGQMLPRFFQPGVVVSNQAESGESLRSSLGAKRLDKVLSTMKPGDYLFIQYGHNDMKEKGEGVGAFTTYKADLKKFITGARQHGGTAVLVTSMDRKKGLGADGQMTNTLGDYPEAVRQTAKEENVPLIDLHAMSWKLYQALGQDNIGKAFQDPTHHNNYGSYELAKCIVEGIRQNKLDLAKFIVADFTDFDPSHPDPVDSFHMPASPKVSSVKPEGN